MKISELKLSICAALLLAATSGAACVSAQKTTDKSAANQTTATPNAASAKSAGVKQIDLPDLKAILKENADARRPLLVNFWATWCVPCREEFPELVKIDNEFRPKNLEFVTVSLDDLADKDTAVLRFLTEMEAAMPAYLLKTADEAAAIAAIAEDYNGALPLTILYDASGKAVYKKMGVIKRDVLRTEIGKVLNSNEGAAMQKNFVAPDDEYGFMFSGNYLFSSYSLKPRRPATPNSPPVISSITLIKFK